MSASPPIRFLYLFTWLLTFIGSAGSLKFMLAAGQNQKSILLILLFTAWVISPNIAQLVILQISNRWPALTRTVLYAFMILITLGSVIYYSGMLSIPDVKPAAVFLIVPFVSWVLLVTAFLIIKAKSS